MSGFDPNDPAIVALWDELPLWSALAGERLLEHLPPAAMRARRALDLGSGTGFPALELAERLGPDALVVGVDPWRSAMLRAAAKRAAWPVANAALVRGDGAALPLRDASVDLVVSNLGVNNFEEPARAFAEVRRVLVPGGTLALSTNLVGHFRELYEAFAHVLDDAGDTEALTRLREHVAHRATVERLEASLAAAQLRVTAVHTHEASWRVRDGRALMAHHFIALGFQPAWRAVAGERADATMAALTAALDRRAEAAGELRLTVPLAVVVATTA